MAFDLFDHLVRQVLVKLDDLGVGFFELRLDRGAEFGDHIRDMSGRSSIFLPSLVIELVNIVDQLEGDMSIALNEVKI